MSMEPKNLKQRLNGGISAPSNGNKTAGKPQSSAIPDDLKSASLTTSIILVWAVTLSYIFGGCCSNVWTLESIIKSEPNSGYLITFTQFFLTALVASWPNIKLSSQAPWVFQRPKIPLVEWAPNIALFLAVNVLNNAAFGYRISVPVHIILRSGGSVTTMLVGSLMGRRYSAGQVAGVALLTAGVVTAAMADAQTKGKMSSGSDTDMQSFVTGLTILFVAQVLSAFLGIRTQALYAKYGPQWQENMFYSHLFSLPFFMLTPSKIIEPLARMSKSKAMDISYGQVANLELPREIVLLLSNAGTQLFCILGVNRLGAVTTALGLTIVLNIRKLVSLFLSTWLFGNKLPFFVWVGAALVFAGGAVYAGGDRWLEARKRAKPDAKKEL